MIERLIQFDDEDSIDMLIEVKCVSSDHDFLLCNRVFSKTCHRSVHMLNKRTSCVGFLYIYSNHLEHQRVRYLIKLPAKMYMYVKIRMVDKINRNQ